MKFKCKGFQHLNDTVKILYKTYIILNNAKIDINIWGNAIVQL